MAMLLQTLNMTVDIAQDNFKEISRAKIRLGVLEDMVHSMTAESAELSKEALESMVPCDSEIDLDALEEALAQKHNQELMVRRSLAVKKTILFAYCLVLYACNYVHTCNMCVYYLN